MSEKIASTIYIICHNKFLNIHTADNMNITVKSKNIIFFFDNLVLCIA